MGSAEIRDLTDSEIVFGFGISNIKGKGKLMEIINATKRAILKYTEKKKKGNGVENFGVH